MANPAQGSEFDIIARHFKPLAAGDAGALDLSDDAAVLDVPEGQRLVVTTDAVVAGVHFLENLSPQDIAHKVVGVNLSDLAAMGARPRAVFLAAQFPIDVDDAWIEEFASGLSQALASDGAVLMGGDTVGTPGPLTLTLTALGFARKNTILTRAGAKDGDDLYVSGTIGDGALGLLCLTGELDQDAHLIARYARPHPRTQLGLALAERGLATACVDVSDGLAADVGHICEASGVRAEIIAADVPTSDAASRLVEENADLLNVVLTGGDDYELAFTARPENAAAIQALSTEMNLALTRIGSVKADGQGVCVLDSAGADLNLSVGGYSHL